MKQWFFKTCYFTIISFWRGFWVPFNKGHCFNLFKVRLKLTQAQWRRFWKVWQFYNYLPLWKYWWHGSVSSTFEKLKVLRQMDWWRVRLAERLKVEYRWSEMLIQVWTFDSGELKWLNDVIPYLQFLKLGCTRMSTIYFVALDPCVQCWNRKGTSLPLLNNARKWFIIHTM